MPTPFPYTVAWLLVLVLRGVILFLLPLAYLEVVGLICSVRESETQTEHETFRTPPRPAPRRNAIQPARPVPAAYAPLSEEEMSRVMSHRDPFLTFCLYAEYESNEFLLRVHSVRLA